MLKFSFGNLDSGEDGLSHVLGARFARWDAGNHVCAIGNHQLAMEGALFAGEALDDDLKLGK